jgi:hypothetical protein
VELTNKLGNKIEAATLHVIGKKVVEENRPNSKISTKWQILYLGKESRLSSSSYFHHNFRLKNLIALILVALES